jgi:hypothetical protein
MTPASIHAIPNATDLSPALTPRGRKQTANHALQRSLFRIRYKIGAVAAVRREQQCLDEIVDVAGGYRLRSTIRPLPVAGLDHINHMVEHRHARARDHRWPYGDRPEACTTAVVRKENFLCRCLGGAIWSEFGFLDLLWGASPVAL